MLENYPSYLVPDTNCFIDHLNGLHDVVASGDFTLVIPLVGKFIYSPTIYPQYYKQVVTSSLSWSEEKMSLVFWKFGDQVILAEVPKTLTLISQKKLMVTYSKCLVWVFCWCCHNLFSVMNELDGLKKDFQKDKYHDVRHAQLVMNNARLDTLQYSTLQCTLYYSVPPRNTIKLKLYCMCTTGNRQFQS